MRQKTGFALSIQDSAQLQMILDKKHRTAEQDKIHRRNIRLQKIDTWFLLILGIFIAIALVVVIYHYILVFNLF